MTSLTSNSNSQKQKRSTTPIIILSRKNLHDSIEENSPVIHSYQFAIKNQVMPIAFRSDNDILIEQAQRRTEVRRLSAEALAKAEALAQEGAVVKKASLDAMKASRPYLIFDCELVSHLPLS